MKFDVSFIGALPYDITNASVSLSAPWMLETHTILLINNEIIDVTVTGITAVFNKRGIYKTTPSFHPSGSNVYLLSVSRPLVYEAGLLLSGVYPVTIAVDTSSSAISISGIDFFENAYARFSLVSKLYPMEKIFGDSSASSISAIVTVAQYPDIKDDKTAISTTLVGVTRTSVTRKESSNTELVGLSQSLISVTKRLTVINTAYADNTGFDIQIVAGTLAETLVNTAYTDNTGFDIQIVAGTLV